MSRDLIIGGYVVEYVTVWNSVIRPLPGTVLRTMRKRRGYTLKQMAEMLGCTESSYHRYEMNQRQLPNDLPTALAAFFGCNVADFLPPPRPLVHDA